ncbi:MAG: hypothetical protein IPF58_11240 [Saprospirales bacterium]|nr:hypothetical protein [Saprospirales bacterium]
MVEEIIWSTKASITFDENIKFLEEFWSDNEVERFVNHADISIDLIKHHPLAFPKYKKYYNIRKALVVKQVSLFYKYYPKQKKIQLLFSLIIFRNHQNLNYNKCKNTIH